MKSLVFASAAVAALLGACTNNDKDDSITTDEYDQVAQSVGSSTATGNGGGDVGAMSDTAVIATGGLPLGFTVSGSGSITGVHAGLDYSYSLTCKDANGTTLAVCTALTDSAQASLSWNGSLALPNISATVQRDGNWSVTGLQSDTATFNGDGSFSYDAMIANVGWHFDYDASYDGVVVNNASHVAADGSLSYDITASKDVNGNTTRSFALHADVDIHADGTATVDLDGVHHYTLNLSTGVVVKVD